MPGGNKYSVQTKNRFALADSSAESDSGSEDVAQGNFDPYQMIQTATADAVKKTKEDIKNAKKNALIKKVEPAEEKKNDDEKPKGNRKNNNNNKGREPRGNQQQRRGPRNERAPKDGEGDVAQNNQPLGENNQPRQRRERRQNDRKSGDPKTGRRAEEKRGGAGKGNWGKADKVYNDEEKPTPEATGEEKPAEKPVDGEAAPEEQENQEPEEPAGPAPISLDEYMASLGVSEAPKNLRQANDGADVVQGKGFRSDKIHKENLTSFKPVERTNNKEYIAAENLSFVSRADKGGFYYTDNRKDNNRGDRGDRRERGGNRGGNKGGQPKEFNLKAMKEEAFPSLGGKVAAK
jgi:hypothetical protein